MTIGCVGKNMLSAFLFNTFKSCKNLPRID